MMDMDISKIEGRDHKSFLSDNDNINLLGNMSVSGNDVENRYASSMLRPSAGDLVDPEGEKVSKGKQIKEKMKMKIAKVKQDIKEKKEKKRSKNGQIKVTPLGGKA